MVQGGAHSRLSPVKRMVQLLLFPSYKEGCSSISKEEKFLK